MQNNKTFKNVLQHPQAVSPKLLDTEQQQIAHNLVIPLLQQPIGPPIAKITPTTGTTTIAIVNKNVGAKPPSIIPPNDNIVKELNNAIDFKKVAERLQLLKNFNLKH